MVTRKQVKTT